MSTAENAALRRQIEALERRIPQPQEPGSRIQFVDALCKAEKVAHATGDSVSHWTNSESLTQYRQRLLTRFKRHSASWKDADLSRIDGAVLDIAEEAIYGDAMINATRTGSGTGSLREVVETDRSGRRISRFYGDPEMCWGSFKQTPKRLIGVNTKA